MLTAALLTAMINIAASIALVPFYQLIVVGLLAGFYLRSVLPGDLLRNPETKATLCNLA